MAALGRRDFSAALDQANAGLKVDPKDPGLAKAAVQAQLGYAEQLWARGSAEEALNHFLPVREQPLRAAASQAELREADLAAPYLWGDLVAATDLPTALAEYEKAYRIDSSYRDVRNKVFSGNVTLANQFLSRGDRAGAAKYVNAARSVDPNRPELNDLVKALTPTS
jgi:tetratricopeptide (TPR) repeat protein